jgi:hypothetical protein
MKNIEGLHWKAAELAARWNTHPTTVLRIMRRFGFSGAKLGPGKQAGRRFSDRDVHKVEGLTGLNGE